MKAVKSTRFNNEEFAGETSKRGTKLTPNKKSGKERHNLYRTLEENEDDDEIIDDYTPYSRESALDYIDDGADEDEDE